MGLTLPQLRAVHGQYRVLLEDNRRFLRENGALARAVQGGVAQLLAQRGGEHDVASAGKVGEPLAAQLARVLLLAAQAPELAGVE